MSNRRTNKMPSYIKKSSSTVTELRNGAGDVVLSLTAGPHPTLEHRNDGKTYYHLSSRMLDLGTVSASKQEVLGKARAALEQLLDALNEMEKEP